MNNIRIGFIELHDGYSLDGRKKFLEIVCWEENKYYDNEENNDNLRVDGYERQEDGSWYNKYTNSTISSSCTKKKETCYTLCVIDMISDDEYNIVCTSRRPFDLSDVNKRDFLKVLNIFDEFLAEERIRSNEYDGV